ncbi:MAG: putative adenylate [Prolixibacteraceae bacterium]|nr:MAG: putative adenylate [Prolixibacteraceae bacterium]
MQEIERKFLIKTELWQPSAKGVEIKQGYLSVDPERVVRVRVAGEKAFLAIKGKPEGIVRTELEYEIPKNHAEGLLKICLGFPVEKIRFKEKIGELVWEIDVFKGENEGLIMAEVELAHENQNFDLPDWIGEEVSSDSRYYNSWLSGNPYSGWGK